LEAVYPRSSRYPSKPYAPLIAIIGVPRSGKSHYFAVLIERSLKAHVAIDFNAFLIACDDMTIDAFKGRFKGPLFHGMREIYRDYLSTNLTFRMSFHRHIFWRYPQ